MNRLKGNAVIQIILRQQVMRIEVNRQRWATPVIE
jgi:hypothetical protein